MVACVSASVPHRGAAEGRLGGGADFLFCPPFRRYGPGARPFDGPYPMGLRATTEGLSGQEYRKQKSQYDDDHDQVDRVTHGEILIVLPVPSAGRRRHRV